MQENYSRLPSNYSEVKWSKGKWKVFPFTCSFGARNLTESRKVEVWIYKTSVETRFLQKILYFLQDTFWGKANPSGKIGDVGPRTFLLTKHIKNAGKFNMSVLSFPFPASLRLNKAKLPKLAVCKLESCYLKSFNWVKLYIEHDSISKSDNV